MREVAINRGVDPYAEPKKRGRPPKRSADDQQVVKAKEGESVYGPRSKKRSSVVPPPPPEDSEPVVPRALNFDGEESPEDPPQKDPGEDPPALPASPVPLNQPSSWPTRATFAGRKKPPGDSGDVFDTRRSKFYKFVPSDLWKDNLERFWNKCTSCDTLDKALDEFMADQGREPPSSSSCPAAAPRGRGRGRAPNPKVKGAAKPKEPGRNRGRGRTRGKAAK